MTIEQLMREWGVWYAEGRELLATQPGSMLYDPLGWQDVPDPLAAPQKPLTPTERLAARQYAHARSNPQAARVSQLLSQMARAGDKQARAARVLICKWGDGLMRSEADIRQRMCMGRGQVRELVAFGEGLIGGAMLLNARH